MQQKVGQATGKKWHPSGKVSPKTRKYYNRCNGADLNVYCGNSGSPVFDRETHEVIGLVVRGDNQDFRWTGKGWLSIIYPHPDFHSQEPQCTSVTEFIDYCR